MHDVTDAASRHPEPERPERHAAHGSSRPKRASRALVRTWAWTAGALSFLSPFALFGLYPKPAQGAATTRAATKVSPTRRPVVVIVTKKIVYTHAATSSTSSSGPINYVYAPAAPAVATSCATPPC
ncbi:MAG: hypothetical protein ACXVP7_10995 [Actinomycetota bacterium]